MEHSIMFKQIILDTVCKWIVPLSFPIALSLKMFFKIFYLSLILRNLIIIYLDIVFLLVSCASWNLLSFMEYRLS